MWESITAVGTMALAGVALLAWYSQNKSFKLTLGADLLMKLDERFQKPNFKQSRAEAASSLRDHDDEGRAEDVFDFFDTMGLFVRRGALDKEFVHNAFFHWINLYWVAGRDHIRRRQSVSKELWCDFEYLYRKVLEIEKRRDPRSKDIELSQSSLEDYLANETSLLESE
jgi:hypothetical protein